MMEVKADKLEASFEAIERDEDGVKALKAELDALKGRIADQAIAAQLPAIDGVKSAEANNFTERFMRLGIESGLEAKSIDNATPGAGGFAIPREIDARIDATLLAISPIRKIANVVKVGSSNYRKLIASGGFASGWVGTEALRPETTSPVYSEIIPPSGDLYANPAASQHMLDDAMFNVGDWLAHEVGNEFARAEGAAFIKGTGVSQPMGFLTSPSSAAIDSARAMGTLQFIGTGVSAGFPAANPADRLVDLVQTLRQPYRQGAVFVMNSATAAQIRKFKTTDGAFIWQPGLMGGQPATLLGYPLIEAEDMPDVAASSLSVAFGNFNAGYTITERNETSILRDPYTKKPYVYFYATKRVGGMVVNSEAIKLLKFI